MQMPSPLNSFTLAAIDLDGTLLSPDLTISAANLNAIKKLQAAGAEVVIASGRHYESLRPFVELLPGVKWVVSVQGGEVSDARRENVLQRAFLDHASLSAVLELGETIGCSAVAYAVEGVFTSASTNPDIEFYGWLAGRVPVTLSQVELLAKEVFKIVWIGLPERIAALREIEQVAKLKLQIVRTHERIMEFSPPGVSKGTGLGVLAEHLRLRAEDAVVFGDAENDVPMFEWAGTSVAMPHAWPVAITKATITGPVGPKETALALAVDAIL